VTLASRCDWLCEGSKASTEWSVAKHQWNIADRLYQGFIDFDFGTHGNTAEQIMSM
jgi:nucleoside-specific outer membrane channel protein Tsx